MTPAHRFSATLQRYGLALTLCLSAGGAHAEEVQLSIAIPQVDVAVFHRPYLAAWIEREDHSVAAQLAVWYQVSREQAPAPARASNNDKTADAKPATSGTPGLGGSKWLPELRQWWRRGGRDLSLPVDGLSSATRAVGTHTLHFDTRAEPLASLQAGPYLLRIEAAREEGGRELIEIPFQWPLSSGQSLQAQGSRELGAVQLSFKP